MKDPYCQNCGVVDDLHSVIYCRRWMEDREAWKRQAVEVGTYLDTVTQQRDALMELVRKMRRIARPYPQWERWWDQLGGEALDLENKMTEGEDDN